MDVFIHPSILGPCASGSSLALHACLVAHHGRTWDMAAHCLPKDMVIRVCGCYLVGFSCSPISTNKI